MQADPYLGIETSTRWGSVAVGRGDGVMAEVVLGLRSRHAESLVPAIEFALHAAGVRKDALAGIVVGGGPGSFTGVRIAAATAKGLVHVLSVPLFAYPGLLALAASVGAERRPVCALFDARRGEVYGACYRFPGFCMVEELLAPVPRHVDEVVRMTIATDPLYVGDGAEKNRERIARQGGVVMPSSHAVPRASALLWLADLDPERGRVASPAEWEPTYLRGAGVGPAGEGRG